MTWSVFSWSNCSSHHISRVCRIFIYLWRPSTIITYDKLIFCFFLLCFFNLTILKVDARFMKCIVLPFNLPLNLCLTTWLSSACQPPPFAFTWPSSGKEDQVTNGEDALFKKTWCENEERSLCKQKNNLIPSSCAMMRSHQNSGQSEAFLAFLLETCARLTAKSVWCSA